MRLVAHALLLSDANKNLFLLVHFQLKVFIFYIKHFSLLAAVMLLETCL